MKRLFDDTDLTNELNYNELQCARKATELMYPSINIAGSLDLGYNSSYDSDDKKDTGPAFEFAKNMASGEVVKLFLHDIQAEDNSAMLHAAIKSVYSILDARLNHTNKRELDFITYIKKLSFETKYKITMIMDILFGRALSETVVQRLKGEKAEEAVQQMREDIVQEQNAQSQFVESEE